MYTLHGTYTKRSPDQRDSVCIVQYSALLYIQVPGVMEQIICTLVSLLRKTTHWKAHLNQICKLELYLHWKHM